MVPTLLPPHCVHKLYETKGCSRRFILLRTSSKMETMLYPCSPLIPFSTQHEESSYLLWSPQLLIPLENANMCDAVADPSPDQHEQQQQDHEFMDTMIQEANGLLLQDELSNGDPLLACFDLRQEGQENGSPLLVQEDFMEESSLSDLLVAGARAVEAWDSIGASAILSRLDDLISGVPYRSCHHAAAAVSSSDHLACYFAGGLRSRISGVARTECHPAAAPSPASRMPAYRMLQELSPFIKFAHFTANQAILEATADDPAVHIVDLNVGEGLQWALLMSDLARHGGKPFHLTAAVADSGAAAGAHPTAARWLSEFAESLNLPFRYSSLLLRSEEDLRGFTASCNGGGGGGGGPVIVSCDTTDKSYSSLIRLQTQLLGSVKILQPKLVILIEQELFRIDRNNPTPLFVEFFREVLQHFAAMVEALESCFIDGGYGACLGLVEKETLGPMIEDAVRQYGCLTGGAGAGMEGFRACDISSFNVAQGKMLAGLFSRGFGVGHEEGRLALCWNSRPLTSVSVWSPV